jgi:hypothetical protein
VALLVALLVVYLVVYLAVYLAPLTLVLVTEVCLEEWDKH